MSVLYRNDGCENIWSGVPKSRYFDRQVLVKIYQKNSIIFFFFMYELQSSSIRPGGKHQLTLNMVVTVFIADADNTTRWPALLRPFLYHTCIENNLFFHCNHWKGTNLVYIFLWNTKTDIKLLFHLHFEHSLDISVK